VLLIEEFARNNVETLFVVSAGLILDKSQRFESALGSHAEAVGLTW
jgi:hypothetical protein